MKKLRFKNALSALCLVAAGIGLVTVMATPAPAQYYPGGPLDWRRTPDGVSLGFTAETEISYQKYKTVGVTGATLIRGFPVDFMMTHTAKKPKKEKQELYDLMDKFLAQQVALNAAE